MEVSSQTWDVLARCTGLVSLKLEKCRCGYDTTSEQIRDVFLNNPKLGTFHLYNSVCIKLLVAIQSILNQNCLVTLSIVSENYSYGWDIDLSESLKSNTSLTDIHFSYYGSGEWRHSFIKGIVACPSITSVVLKYQQVPSEIFHKPLSKLVLEKCTSLNSGLDIFKGTILSIQMINGKMPILQEDGKVRMVHVYMTTGPYEDGIFPLLVLISNDKPIPGLSYKGQFVQTPSEKFCHTDNLRVFDVSPKEISRFQFPALTDLISKSTSVGSIDRLKFSNYFKIRFGV